MSSRDNGNHKHMPPEYADHEEREERTPELLPSLPGRVVSVAGVVERIVEEFHIEHGDYETNAVQEATTESARRALVRDVAQYIFGVESLRLSPAQQARIIGQAYSELFGFGPLDALFADEQINTISLDGSQRLSVRRKPGGDLEAHEPIFDDERHLFKMLQRLLRHANATLDSESPVVETGITVGQRRICLNVALPPYAPEISADIRLHPAQPPTLEQLAERGFLSDEALTLVQAIVQSEHGFVIVGDVEAGKTTLFSALAARLPGPEGLLSVERAGELSLPEGAQRLVVQWKTSQQEQITFGQRIEQAVEQQPQTLVLDEVRSDEPEAIAPLLHEDSNMRQIWLFRGSSVLKRTQSALTMLARRANPGQSEALVQQMQRRMPFLLVVRRRNGYLQLTDIAEWQRLQADTTHLSLVPLLELGEEGSERTGKTPQRGLDLPRSFWA